MAKRNTVIEIKGTKLCLLNEIKKNHIEFNIMLRCIPFFLNNNKSFIMPSK